MATSPTFSTADLSDAAGPLARPCLIPFQQFGGRLTFSGRIRTVRCHADNLLVRRQLETPAAGDVLVVDGGGNLEFALVGDVLGGLAVRHGWSGLVIYGAVRDTVALATLPLGVKALGPVPRRGDKLGAGETDVPVVFGGVTFTPGHWLYSDADGIVVAASSLVA
jgi:regulator of ribonuclease activity A